MAVFVIQIGHTILLVMFTCFVTTCDSFFMYCFMEKDIITFIRYIYIYISVVNKKCRFMRVLSINSH
jgi:hypothetical protein